MGIDDMTRGPGGRPIPRGSDDACERLGEDAYRATIARRLLSIGLVIGTILIIPTFYFALREGDLSLIGFEGGVYLSFVLLAALRRLPSKVLYSSLVGLGSSLGLYLVLRYQTGGAGEVWLEAAAVLATLFFGGTGGLVACGVMGLAYITVFAVGEAGLLGWKPDPTGYFLHALNVVGLSSLTCFAVTRLVEGYRGALRAQGSLSVELARHQIELEREAAGRACAEERADFLASHDSLTRLPNRESFRKGLERAVAVAEGRGRILAVMVLGLDRFKRITSARGPGAGDEILSEAAKRLARNFRQDDLVGRLEGDQFSVLFSDVKSHEDVRDIIEKARRAFDRSFSAGGSELAVSASFGVALFPHDGRESDSLLRAAESALHLAKEDGPGSYRIFDAALHAGLLERLRVEHEIGAAVRLGAFEPWFQPKVDCLGRVVGAEALARWNLPGGGLRQPADFIAAAERSGAIAELGRTVLYKACRRAVEWERSGLAGVPVSVNLSPFQFRSASIVPEIRGILADTGLDPARLDLEITESGIMENEYEAVEKLAELKAMGLKISIDDFGTGYSSFAMLKDFPVDTVKLPKSFIEPLPGDIRATMIAEAVIDLAHNLHFSVVAEGVETRAQFSWLDRARCDHYQGYLFSPPLSASRFASALAGGLPAIVE